MVERKKEKVVLFLSKKQVRSILSGKKIKISRKGNYNYVLALKGYTDKKEKLLGQIAKLREQVKVLENTKKRSHKGRKE